MAVPKWTQQCGYAWAAESVVVSKCGQRGAARTRGSRSAHRPACAAARCSPGQTSQRAPPSAVQNPTQTCGAQGPTAKGAATRLTERYHRDVEWWGSRAGFTEVKSSAPRPHRG
jgi:hypothetical protein